MFQKHINIFLSSTFQDMQAERDYLKKNVLPRLQEALFQYGITVNMTDLRWGVDTSSEDESKREAKVLRVCLDAIKRDRPFFIGIIGGRYGWVPPSDRVEQIVGAMKEDDQQLLSKRNGCSVTEMEILFGALGSKDVLPHSFFFFRNADVYDTIPEEFRTRYIEQNTESTAKLEALRGRIVKECQQNGLENNVQYFDTSWDEKKECLGGFEDFGDKVFNSILNEILESNGRDAYVSESEFEQRSFDAFVTQRLDGFCGRREIVPFLEEFLLNFNLLDVNRVNGYFLSGFSGCGKSSVFCKVYADLSSLRQDSKIVILAHAAGITVDSCDPKKMLQRWIEKMKSLPEISSDDVDNTDFDLISKFGNLLIRAICAGYKPIVLIDSYDSFQFGDSSEDKALKTLSFIPFNVPLLCTTLPSYVETIVRDRTSFKIIELQSFSKDEALELINHTLNIKELPQRMVEQIISKQNDDGKPAYSSPLWLRIALSLLDEIGDKHFQEINRETFERDDLKIASYLEKLIQGLSPDVATLFRQFVDLSCNFFAPELVKTTMLFAALSGSGISEQEIEYMIPSVWNELEFASFARWMRSFFLQNPITGRWVLGHNILKELMQSLDVEMTSNMREKYIDILSEQDLDESSSSVLELLYQIIAYQDFDSFMKFNKKWKSISNTKIAWKIRESTNSKLNKEIVGDFFVKAIEKYVMEPWLCGLFIFIMYDWLEYLDTYDGIDKCFMRDGLSAALSCFTQEIISSRDIFENWLILHDLYRDMFDYEGRDALFPEFLKICMDNKAYLIGRGFSLYYYNQRFFMILFDHTNIPWSQYCHWGGYISMEEKTRLSAEGTRRWLEVIPIVGSIMSFERGEETMSKVIAEILDSVDKYGKNFYSASEQALLHAAVDSLKDSLNIEEEKEEEQQSEVDGSEPAAKQGFFRSKDNRTQDEKPVCKIIDENYSPLEYSRIALKKYIATNLKNNSDDNYIELSKLYINLANELIASGQDEEAFKQIRLCAGICMNNYIFLPYAMMLEKSSYVIYNYSMEGKRSQPLRNIADWYISIGQVEEAVFLLEKAYLNSRLWLAFLSDCDAVRHLLFKLKELYCKLGRIEQAACIVGEYMEFLLRHPLLLSRSSPNSYIDIYISLLHSAGMDDLAEVTLSRCKIWNNNKVEILDSTEKYRKIRHYINGYSAVGIPGYNSYCCIWGYTDKTGQVKVPPKYNDAGYFSEGLAMVGIGEGDRTLEFGVIGMKYGYIDVNGNEVIPLEYDYASAFYKGEALVVKDGEFYYIDTKGCKTRNFIILKTN